VSHGQSVTGRFDAATKGIMPDDPDRDVLHLPAGDDGEVRRAHVLANPGLPVES
jgi:hypothetical protein